MRTTAGPVTSAAIVMVAVFAIFATLPATMKLLGDWNRYLPRTLQRLPRVAPHAPARRPARALS